MKELFVPFLCTFCALFRYFLSTLSVTYFEHFLREKCSFPVKLKCLGKTPTILRKCKLIEKSCRNKSLLNDLFLTCLLDLVSKILVPFHCYNNYERER